MSSVEWVSVVRHAALLDHTHTREHVMALLDGEMHEDGRGLVAGDIRVSTAEDRHFLRFVRPSQCLVVEGAAPALRAGRRRVLRLPGLLADLRDITSKDRAVAFAAGDRLADAIGGCAPPSWLVEFERCLIDGGFGRADMHLHVMESCCFAVRSSSLLRAGPAGNRLLRSLPTSASRRAASNSRPR